MSTVIDADFMQNKVKINDAKATISYIVSKIDEELLKCSIKKIKPLKFKLPPFFDLGPITKRESQIILYSELKNIYANKRKLIVSFDISNKFEHYIIINWNDGMCEIEKNIRLSLLNS